MRMPLYLKQNLPVQFLTFGVDPHGIIIPILKRGGDNFVHLPKDDFIQLPPVDRFAKPQPKNTPPSR